MTSRKSAALLTILLIAVTVPAALFADGMGTTDPSLIGTWKWISADTAAGGLAPTGDAVYSITFMADGTVTMKMEINNVRGSWEADGRTLTIVPPMAMTLAAWQPGSPAPALLKLIEKSRDYRISGTELSITASGAAGTMRFEKQ